MDGALNPYIFAFIFTGVSLSLLFEIMKTPNPAKVPLKRVWLRALPGFLIYLTLYSAISSLVFFLTQSYWPLDDSWPGLQYCLAVSLGLACTQLYRIKNIPFGSQINTLTSLIQEYDEITRVYLAKLFSREERKMGFDWFEGDHSKKNQVVAKLFEFHLVEIAKHAIDSKNFLGDPLDMFKIRFEGVKFKYLLRFLGYRDTVNELRSILNDPSGLYPDWSGDDRRENSNNGSAGKKNGLKSRRRYEEPFVIAYIKGEHHAKNLHSPSV